MDLTILLSRTCAPLVIRHGTPIQHLPLHHNFEAMVRQPQEMEAQLFPIF
jgi:hypothetical protein